MAALAGVNFQQTHFDEIERLGQNGSIVIAAAGNSEWAGNVRVLHARQGGGAPEWQPRCPRRQRLAAESLSLLERAMVAAGGVVRRCRLVDER